MSDHRMAAAFAVLLRFAKAAEDTRAAKFLGDEEQGPDFHHLVQDATTRMEAGKDEHNRIVGALAAARGAVALQPEVIVVSDAVKKQMEVMTGQLEQLTAKLAQQEQAQRDRDAKIAQLEQQLAGASTRGGGS